jgi:hypothetical protein
LEPIANCGVAGREVYSKFIILSFESVIASFGYGEELSSSTLLLVIELADTRTSNSQLEI